MPQYFYFIEHGQKHGEMLGIRKGKKGYFRTGKVCTKAEAQDHNRKMGVTEADGAAMLLCAMTGDWSDYDKIVVEWNDTKIIAG